MQIDMTDEERDILIRWKKRSDTYRLVRMKAEAIVYAARGVGLDIIAEMVERAEGTVREWLSEWRQTRLGSVVTGHAGNENASKLKLAQKVLEQGLSVRQTENLAPLFSGNNETGEKPRREPVPQSFKRAQRQLRLALDTNVKVKRVRNKNKVEIEFADEEELAQLVDRLSGGMEAL